MSGALTRDGFLGGRVHVWQPVSGYRAGVDPVLLAAAVPAQSGQSVLELGCGAGTASLCLAARVPDLDLTGVEVQASYADLARRSATENAAPMTVVEADLSRLPTDLRQRSFDHVIANPPYYQRDRSTPATDAGRDLALGGETPLSTWVEVGAKRLAPKGYLTLIQRADRLPDVLGALEGRLGSVRVLPIAPREGRPAQLVIVQARKGGRADFMLEAPFVMHAGPVHLSDGDDYAPKARAVLRDGAPIHWA